MAVAERYEFITILLRDSVFIISLARPPVNVIHAPMMAEIASAMDLAEADPEVRALVITGQGRRAFSAGVEVADHSREHIGELMKDMLRLMRRIEEFPLPTIAALNGITLGGGLELALCCDMMIAAAGVRLGFPEIKIASIAFPGILLLQGRLPTQHIVEWLASGESVSAEEAHRLGLLNRVIDGDDFKADVLRFAEKYTAMSRPVLSLMMRALKMARGRRLDTGFDDASALYMNELLPLEDVSEGLAAFSEKRAPAWKHR